MVPASSNNLSQGEQHFHCMNKHQNFEGGLPLTHQEICCRLLSSPSHIQQKTIIRHQCSTKQNRNDGEGEGCAHANSYHQHHFQDYHDRQQPHQTRSQELNRFPRYQDQSINVELSSQWQSLSGTPNSPLSFNTKNFTRNLSICDATETTGQNNGAIANLIHVLPDHSYLPFGKDKRALKSSAFKRQVVREVKSSPVRGMAPTVLHGPQLSLQPSSSRTNKIHVRIKRPVQEQTKDEDQTGSTRYISRSHPHSSKKRIRESSRISPFISTGALISRGSSATRGEKGVAQMKQYDPKGADNWSEGNLEISRVASCVKNQAIADFDKVHQLLFPSDKMIMTRRLLSMECGPLWWNLRWKPPDSFVLYLTDVLTTTVKEYLKTSRGNVYWVKHVRFWINLLNPDNQWWTTEQGSIYNDFAQRLFLNLLNRWGRNSSSDLIECHDARDQTTFLRACVLFASRDERSSDNGADALSNDRSVRHCLLRSHVDEYVKKNKSITVETFKTIDAASIIH